jgi:hypothetical protein
MKYPDKMGGRRENREKERVKGRDGENKEGRGERGRGERGR